MTLLLGAALSIGGIADVLDNVHFLVRRELDTVRVVRQRGSREVTVARIHEGFAASSVFRIAQIFPHKLVSRQLALFDEGWIPRPERVTEDRSPFHEEMARISSTIRHDFFSHAVPYGDLIHEKARKYDVDPALVAAVIETESRFQHRAHSRVGARGLMQLMPRTGRWMGAGDLYDPEQNVDAGVKYIKYLQDRFHGNLKQTIAAYNAGEGNVKRYGGVPPFSETRAYVKNVMRRYQTRTDQLKAYDADRSSGGSVSEADGTLALR